VIFFFVIVFLCIPPAWGDQVRLSTPQSEYFALAGTDAAVPIMIASTYDHDITGTLILTMVPEGAGPQNASTRTRAFSAFTDERTVSLDLGKSDVPADYLLTVSFRYHENGDRSATIAGIAIHYVTAMETPAPGQSPVTGTDLPVAQGALSSGGSSPATTNPQSSPLSSLVNSQVPQDTRAIQNAMQGTVNQSMQQQDELAGYIAADPVISGFNRTLSAAGYTPKDTVILPVSNTSGSFSLVWISKKKTAVITGTVNNTMVPFAVETSEDPVLLPDPLTANASFSGYARTVAAAGFSLNRTTINATRDRQEIDLAFVGPDNRIIHATAVLTEGTVTAFNGDSPDAFPAFAGPALALAVVILLSAGIWYFARFREKIPPPPVTPAQKETPDEAVWRLLGEADAEARQDRYPEAYRKLGRALRTCLSGTIGDSSELTREELERLIAPVPGTAEMIRRVLERCEAVGFAKDAPDPAEFQELARCARHILSKSRRDKTKD
jgi:hypothetical protein